MPSDFPLRASLTGLQEKMLIDFSAISAQIEHHGAKGHEREALIAQEYLQRYLPRPLEVVHGAEILDSLGNRSAECDLVVQSAATPPLLVGKSFHLIPVEWAYGMVEVKSRLDRAELRDARIKISRVKALRKLTYLTQTGDIQWGINAYGQRFDHFPMYGLVFAYTAMSLEELCNELWALQRDEPMERWVDAVIVLDQGMLLYRNVQGGSAIRPEPGCTLTAIRCETTLVPATLAVQTAFAAVWERPARLGPYMGPDPWGETVASAGP
jgi:hypothetical protein